MVWDRERWICRSRRRNAADATVLPLADQTSSVGERVATAWRDGDRTAASEYVTDEMVDTLGVAGTPEDARERLRIVASIDIVDRPLLTIPNNALELAKRTIEVLAPAAL